MIAEDRFGIARDHVCQSRIQVTAGELVGTVGGALRDGARLTDLYAARCDTERLVVHVLMSFDRRGEWLRIVSDISIDEPRPMSLTDVAPAAGWYERELVVFLNEGAEAQMQLAAAPDGVVDYPLGPIRSGVVESGHYLLRTVGEEIVDFALRLQYKHRGIERLALEFAPEHLPLLAERISGTDGFAESLAMCTAIEDLVGISAPPRAQYLRTVFAELERLYNHVGYQADLCQATGLVVAQAQFDILRERLLRLNARLAGHRYLFGLNVAGGLARDLERTGLEDLAAEMGEIREMLRNIGSMTFASSSHVDRLEATGILRATDAEAFATVGPIARASGQDRDTRRDHPYAAYAEVDLEIPVYAAGDALARARVRLEEAHQSITVITQLLDRVPPGPVRAAVGGLPAASCGFGWAESARGETVHWVRTDADCRLERYRVRPASVANWQAFPLAIPGHNILTDFPVIEQSFGLSYAGNDR